LLQRALGNLISNALNYTAAEGEIVVFAHPILEGAKIGVKDTGIGIAQEHLSHVFDRFYRVDHSRSGKTGGSGLGLSIVRSIMQVHQGRVEIESQLERGTTVTLIFPSLMENAPTDGRPKQ
jgi:signal transduction histidine kinase